MTTLEIRDHCHSADDVKRAAQASAAWEKRMRGPEPRPQLLPMPEVSVQAIPLPTDHPLHQLIDEAISCIDEFLPRLTIADIQRAVCRGYRITKKELLSRRRAPEVVAPRHFAMLLCKLLTANSLPEIGRRFERDHTTVMHALWKFTWLADRLRSDDLLELPLHQIVDLAKDLILKTPKDQRYGAHPHHQA